MWNSIIILGAITGFGFLFFISICIYFLIDICKNNCKNNCKKTKFRKDSNLNLDEISYIL